MTDEPQGRNAPDLETLQAAFQAFNETTRHLQESYEKLQQHVRALDLDEGSEPETVVERPNEAILTASLSPDVRHLAYQTFSGGLYLREERFAQFVNGNGHEWTLQRTGQRGLSRLRR